MKRILTLITVILTLVFPACSISDILEEAGLSESGDRGDPLEQVELNADYAIGVGWIPFEKTYSGKTRETVNLREAPTTEASIATTVDKGTPLEIYGVSVACSLVMSYEEWSEYWYGESEYVELIERAPPREMGWYRMKYGGEFVWAHAAFVDAGEAPSVIPIYLAFPVASECERLRFDKDGVLQTVTFDDPAESKFSDKVVPFAGITTGRVTGLGYLELQYFGLNAGEPAYDLRRCTPRAFNLYRAKELDESVPGWFDALTDAGVVVADYEETDAGVWLADMAGAKVIYADKGGNIKSECDLFALPLLLTGDGHGGVWVADPYVERIVGLTCDAEPVGLIEDVYADAVKYNAVTEQLWVLGGKPYVSWTGIESPGVLYIYDDKGSAFNRYEIYGDVTGTYSMTYRFEPAQKATFEVNPDGSVVLYLWKLGEGT